VENHDTLQQSETTLLTSVAPNSPAPKLPGLVARERMLTDNIELLMRDLAAERNDALLGIDGAVARAEYLAAELETCQGELASARAAVAALKVEDIAGRQERERTQAAQNRRDAAAACRRQIELARDIQQDAEALAVKLNDFVANGVRLAALMAADLPTDANGRTQADRLYSFGTMRQRIHYALFRTFDAKAVPHGANGLAVSFFPIDLPTRGDQHLKQSLEEREHQIFDNIPIDFFETQAEAFAARDRRDPTGKYLHPVKDEDGMWKLMRGTVQGAAARHGGEPPKRAA